MITYTPCFDLKCECKWQIPFQIQLSPPKGVCLCATDRATRSDVKVSVLFPRLGLFFSLPLAVMQSLRGFLPHETRQEVHLSGVLASIPISCSGHAHSTQPAPNLFPPFFLPFYGHVRKCGKSFTRSGWRCLLLQVEDAADDDVTSVK